MHSRGSTPACSLKQLCNAAALFPAPRWQVLEGLATRIVATYLPLLHRLVDSLALLDMLAGFAAVASGAGVKGGRGGGASSDRQYVRPVLTQVGDKPLAVFEALQQGDRLMGIVKSDSRSLLGIFKDSDVTHCSRRLPAGRPAGAGGGPPPAAGVPGRGGTLPAQRHIPGTQLLPAHHHWWLGGRWVDGATFRKFSEHCRSAAAFSLLESLSSPAPLTCLQAPT